MSHATERLEEMRSRGFGHGEVMVTLESSVRETGKRKVRLYGAAGYRRLRLNEAGDLCWSGLSEGL